MNIDFGSLHLAAMKLSENSEYVIIRLSEQDGKRGILKNIGTFTVMDMIENPEYDAEEYSYKPFEIITIGIKTNDFRRFIKK